MSLPDVGRELSGDPLIIDGVEQVVEEHVLHVEPSIATATTVVDGHSGSLLPITTIIRSQVPAVISPMVTSRTRAYSNSSLIISRPASFHTNPNRNSAPLPIPAPVVASPSPSPPQSRQASFYRVPGSSNSTTVPLYLIACTSPSPPHSQPLSPLGSRSPIPSPTAESIENRAIHFKSERMAMNAWESDNENEAAIHAAATLAIATPEPSHSNLNRATSHNFSRDGVSMDLEPTPGKGGASTSLPLALAQFFVLTGIFIAAFMLPPLQRPASRPAHSDYGHSIASNWVFLFITTPLLSINTLWIYTVWGKAFSGKMFRTSLIPPLLCFALVPLLSALLDRRFPLRGLGLIAISGYICTVPLSFFVRWKINRLPHAGFRILFSFFRLHLYATMEYLAGLAFFVTFVATDSTGLQLLAMLAFALVTCVFKLVILDHTRCHAREHYHSLAAFWTDMYYEAFSALAFPFYKTWSLFVLFLFLRLVVSVCTFVILTEDWWYRHGWFLKLAVSKEVTPVEKYKFAEFGVGATMSFGKAALKMKKNIGIRQRSSRWPLFRVVQRIVFTNMADRKALIHYSVHTYVASSLAQLASPILFIPFAVCMRFSWNSSYLPYENIPSSSFTIAMIFAVVSIAFTFVCVTCVRVATWHSYRAQVGSVARPVVRTHTMYFVYAATSVYSMVFISALYHMRIVDLLSDSIK